jgi:hypothetical protein
MGPQFYTEIGTCALEGQTILDGSFYPAKTIKFYQCKKRVRIGEQPFDFENEIFEKISDQAVACLKDAYNWWNATTP